MHKRNPSIRIILCLTFAAFFSIHAEGQAACNSEGVGCYSTIDIDSDGNISGVSVTEIPYDMVIAVGEETETVGTLLDPSYNVLDQDDASDFGYGYSEADTFAIATDGGEYVETGDHFLLYGQEGELGGTYAWWDYTPPADDSPPDITGIYVDSGSTVRGGSGYIEIFGDFLTTSNGASVTIDGGVTAAVTFDDPSNTNQVNISFMIPADTSTGAHTLTLSNDGGTSSTQLEVDDPTPSIQDVEPGTWSGNTSFSVYGTGFGSNQGTLQISGAGVGTPATISSWNDSEIDGSISLDPGASGPIYLSVVSTGLNGTFYFFQGQDGQSSTNQSATYQVVAAACGQPTGFMQSGPGRDIGNGVLHFEYTYTSTANDTRVPGYPTDYYPSLLSCKFAEAVLYPGASGPGVSYAFPAPFPAQTHANPTGNMVDMKSGVEADNQSIFGYPVVSWGPFIKPYFANSFTAAQGYAWQCTCKDNNWYDIPGFVFPSISIQRSVSQNPSGSWNYTVMKSGSSATINPLP